MSDDKRQIALRVGRAFNVAADKLSAAGIDDAEIGRAMIGVGLARLQASLGPVAAAEMLLTVAATLVAPPQPPANEQLQ